MKFLLPSLPYEYDALEPAISREIMTLHHTKHHQAYIDKLNEAFAKYPEYEAWTIVDLLRRIDELPGDLQGVVRDQGGGHYNHNLFWRCMTPGGATLKSGYLYNAIVQKYGSYEAFVEEFTSQAHALFGSGWVWLTHDVDIITTQNQDNPLLGGGVEPLMGLDVWEHAYYLDYKNRRDDYIRAWWSIVDWDFVAKRYNASYSAVYDRPDIG